MSEIIDHRRDCSVVTKENGFTGKCSNIPKNTTKGWEVLLEFNDDTTAMVYIKDINEVILIKMAEYAVENQIADELSFALWVPYTLKKRNIIISKVKTKYRRTTNKYGVRLPNNVTEAMHIYQSNGNTYWKYDIDK